MISVAIPEAAGADGAFFGLGRLGKLYAKAPATFSPDRSHVVGYACDGGFPSLPCQPFVWRAGRPPSPLALLPGDQNGYAFAISDDGRIVVGSSMDSPNSNFDSKALMWIDGTPVLLDPDPDADSDARYVTPDGSLVAGSRVVGIGPGHAFAWTSADGVIPLLAATQPGFTHSSLRGMSRDGQIVAVLDHGGNSDQTKVLRWTRAAGLELLEPLPSGYLSIDVAGVGYDAPGVGYVSGAVAGNLWVGNQNVSASRAYRWTTANGIELLPLPPGHAESRATQISSDGSTVVGNFKNPAGSALALEAYRWTDSTGIQSLGPAPAGFDRTLIQKMTSDGSAVAASMQSSWTERTDLQGPNCSTSVWRTRTETRAFLWSEASGRVDLPHFPLAYACDHDFSTSIVSTTSDGSLVTGASSCSSRESYWLLPDCTVQIFGGIPYSQWFAWDAAHGTRSLNDYVSSEHGVDLTGWTLTSAYVAEDGKFLWGLGSHDGHDEGWVLYIPEPDPEPMLAAGCGLIAALGVRRRAHGLRTH